MQIHTFEEWNKLGFYIKKGTKATCFIDNVAYFSENTVSKKTKKYYTKSCDNNYNNIHNDNYDEEVYYNEDKMPRAMETEADFYERKLREASSGCGFGPMGTRS